MKLFHRFAKIITDATGSPWVFLAGIIFIFVAGNKTVDYVASVLPLFLLFVIQHTQNRDSVALHKKIDELFRAIEEADDDLQGIERD